mmetsp:Transcript_7653/g.28663  ORF Transcript_7653/g.28663 Transcript_7653/m.28663 type:complete len:260 (+) Transcript_7653:894-1673(+)
MWPKLLSSLSHVLFSMMNSPLLLYTLACLLFVPLQPIASRVLSQDEKGYITNTLVASEFSLFQKPPQSPIPLSREISEMHQNLLEKYNELPQMGLSGAAGTNLGFTCPHSVPRQCFPRCVSSPESNDYWDTSFMYKGVCYTLIWKSPDGSGTDLDWNCNWNFGSDWFAFASVEDGQLLSALQGMIRMHQLSEVRMNTYKGNPGDLWEEFLQVPLDFFQSGMKDDSHKYLLLTPYGFQSENSELTTVPHFCMRNMTEMMN